METSALLTGRDEPLLPGEFPEGLDAVLADRRAKCHQGEFLALRSTAKHFLKTRNQRDGYEKYVVI